MNSLADTIVAPITGGGKSAVGVLRLSGSIAWEIASKVFNKWPRDVESHKAIYGRFVTGDDGLALPFEKSRGYTGEESVEFSIHGSPASMRTLIEACIVNGARFAEPGEFTYRAFMNGRLDLTQAEAVRETIESETSLQLNAANQLRQGVLSDIVRRMIDHLSKEMAAIEASVDFSEEIGEYDLSSGMTVFESVLATLDQLLGTAEVGSLLTEGIRIVIVGQPNAGKSSLLNALLGHERAIVTHYPGTTRDSIDATCELGGFKVILTDTAGLRETEDPIETLGVARSLEAAQKADFIWFLYDASLSWTKADQELFVTFENLLPTERVWKIATKSDLVEGTTESLTVSTLNLSGIKELGDKLTQVLGVQELPSVTIRSRHLPLLLEAKEILQMLGEGAANGIPDDVLVTALRATISCLGEVNGDGVQADTLDRLFSDFCIGK